MLTAIVTMKIKQGKCEENFAFMEAKIQEAIEQQADLIIFPQNAISGYLLGDLWLDDAWCRYVDSFNDKLIAMSEQIAIVWGNIKYRNHRRFNAAFFAYRKQTHMRVKKNEQHPYMDDAMYFENNDINSAIEFKDMVLALNFQDEIQLADLNINLDAQPYDMDRTMACKGNVIYVNAVGMQNCGKSIMVMQGGSFMRTQKKLRYQAPYFHEEVKYIDIHTDEEVELNQPSVLEALRCGIIDFDEQVFGGNIPWVIGLSGGLDSSVTAALLAYSLGNERIYGFNMATNHNSDLTKCNAREEAEALGIHYKEGSIQAFVNASKDVFMNEFGCSSDSTLVQENIQARARGYLLGGFAGILGGVIANNANKVEAALGYCTLYGDSVGAVSFIGDLTKAQLIEVAKELNEVMGKTVVPKSLLPVLQDGKIIWEMAPSAELRADQFDPMKWFYHDYLVDHLGKDLDVITLMKRYLDGSLMQSELGTWITYYGLDDPKAFLKDLDWFLSTMNKNAFKGLQMPPLLSLHERTLSNTIKSQMNYDQKMYEELRTAIENL